MSSLRRIARNAVPSRLPDPPSSVGTNGSEREVLESFFGPKAGAIFNRDDTVPSRETRLLAAATRSRTESTQIPPGFHIPEIGVSVDHPRISPNPPLGYLESHTLSHFRISRRIVDRQRPGISQTKIVPNGSCSRMLCKGVTLMRGSRAIPPTSERPNVRAKYTQLKKVFSGFLGSAGLASDRLWVASAALAMGRLCPFAPFFLLALLRRPFKA